MEPRREGFDPAWIVALLRQQRPEEVEVARALAGCTRCWKRSVAYWYFVDPAGANTPGAAWRFERNITLDGGVGVGGWGPLVLDVLEGGGVGGVEFLDRAAEVP